jgi:phage terminase large subunit-like protein
VGTPAGAGFGENWALQSFQLEFIEDVFRGFPECWLIIPEGNTKTTTMAGLALYGLRFSNDAQIPVAASTRDQTRILYRQAKGFVTRSGLDETDEDGFWFEPFDGYRRIDLRRPGNSKRGVVSGFIEIHAADAGSGDGVIPFPFGILDELHRHKSLDLYETWRGKLEKRKAQLLAISTAGEPASDFEETRKKIRSSGTVTDQQETFVRVESPRLVLHEYAVPETGDVYDFELVAKANPFDAITAEALMAKYETPTMTETHWRRFNCNIPTLSDDIEFFIPIEEWDELATGDEIPNGSPICLGADGSRTWDTTVVSWATAEGERVDVDAKVFSVRPDEPRHVLHSGGKIDFDDVEAFIISLFADFSPAEAAYDPRYLDRSMEIVDRRMPDARIFPIEPQSKHMRTALQTLYRLVAEKTLRHRGDPVIRAHLLNTKVDRDRHTGEIRRVGKIDQRKAIDAVPAIAMSTWRASHVRVSPYRERDLVVL